MMLLSIGLHAQPKYTILLSEHGVRYLGCVAHLFTRPRKVVQVMSNEVNKLFLTFRAFTWSLLGKVQTELKLKVHGVITCITTRISFELDS